MGEEDSKTFVVNEDKTISIKGASGDDIRYVKESDLLAIKGGKVSAETAQKSAEDAATAANQQLSEAVNKQTQAEASVERLGEQLKEHTGTTEELTKLKTDLTAAQGAERGSASELLELRRTFIVSTYKVPTEVVKEKNLGELKLFEEALKAVIGSAGGNYAFGGGGGGAGSLEGKSPMELALMAYAEKR